MPNSKYLDETGLVRLVNWVKSQLQSLTTAIAGKVSTDAYATDSDYGIVKTNSAESVTLNSDGQLDVGGRLGQMSNTTGVFSPKTISPSVVDNGSFLLTEASGTYLGSKSLAVSTGTGLTCRNAPAGSTVYRVTNTYVNRLSCSVLLVADAVAALNEDDAKSGNYARVLSVQRGGAAYVPDSSPNSTAQADDIVITLDKSINPNAATTSLRVYPAEKNFSNLYVGQGVGGNGGASVVVGQRVMSASGNANAIIGADIYNTGNGNGVFGRQHISRKNRSFLAGTGHDTTNAKSDSVAAVGQWSNIDANTLFAVGNGTSHVARSNAFEVTTEAAGGTGLVLQSPSGTRYKLTVGDSGTLDAARIPSLPYLPLAGGTLTGQLNGTAAVFSGNVEGNQLTFGNGAAGTRYYLVAKTPSRNSHVLWAGGGAKADGNVNGTVVGLGAGGLTIVGGGEYADYRYSLGDLNDGDEQLYLGSDNDVTIESNGNTIANRYQLVFNKAGNLMIEAKGNQGYKAVYPYNSNEPPASNTATQILCSYNSDRKREGAYVQPTWMANGGVHAQFGAQVAPGGTPKYHYLSLGYDSDSNPTVNMTAKDKWRDALELGALALGTASQEGAVDCDDLPTGIHYVYNASTNTPTGVGGMCICANVGTNSVQLFVTNDSSTPVHTRKRTGSTWTAWRLVG